MEKFKVDIYLSEHPGGGVFMYESLTDFQSGKVIGMLFSLLGITDFNIPTQAFYPFLEREIEKKIIYNDSIDSELLSTVIETINSGDNNEDIYIIWDIASCIDKMRIGDLIDNWEYIWYDTSDETAVLYMPNNKSIVIVTDRGYLSYKCF